jgi:hypothetical protein
MSVKPHPAASFRCGHIKLAIWLNEAKGARWYSITMVRSYRDSDGTWKDVTSFNAQDLPVVERLLHIAFDWCIGNSASLSTGPDAKPGPSETTPTPERECDAEPF